MKIRIKGNSLRYRLTKTDIANLSKFRYVEEKINFGSQCLTYALKSSPQTELTADFKNNQITLHVPGFMIEQWAATDKVGFENTAGPVHLLIEKDFKCLDTVAEDQNDNYPNPLSFVV